MSADTWDWKYCGEAGDELPARNSHTMKIVTAEDDPLAKFLGEPNSTFTLAATYILLYAAVDSATCFLLYAAALSVTYVLLLLLYVVAAAVATSGVWGRFPGAGPHRRDFHRRLAAKSSGGFILVHIIIHSSSRSCPICYFPSIALTSPVLT